MLRRALCDRAGYESWDHRSRVMTLGDGRARRWVPTATWWSLWRKARPPSTV